jgi:hypothetical protein
MPNPFEFIERLHIQLNGHLIWWVVGVACVVYAIFTAILIFHWEKYGMKMLRMLFVELVYFGVSAVILMLMFASAITISQTF